MTKTRRRKSRKQKTTAPPSVRGIITPWIDFLCCGGLSIIGISLYLAYRLTSGIEGSDQFHLGEITLVAALVNWPHFMASYRLLYSSRLQITRHKWASLGVPAVLLGLVIFALAKPAGLEGDAVLDAGQADGSLFINERIGLGVMLVSHFYLAWHYTGQAWGMVAAFGFVGGVRMDATERWLIRSGLRLLLVWHVVWASQELAEYYSPGVPFDTVFQVLAVIGFVVFVLGLIGFNRIWDRTGQTPSLRMMAPWAAAWLWYALLYVEPSAFFWVQISHALQYMIFPIRVELNQHRTSGSAVAGSLRATVYYLILVLTGVIVFYLPETLISHGNPQNNLAILIAAAVNIHHYFVDGVIWKIRNPEVQRDLFSHLSDSTGHAQ